MSIPVTNTPGALGLDCYPEDPQTLGDAIVEAMQSSVDVEFSGIFYSVDEPAGEDADIKGIMAWFNLKDYNLYWYVGSVNKWVRKNPMPANGGERRIFVGSEADVWAYDGGDGTNPGAFTPNGATGAMWEVDTTFAARFPVGVGSFPSGASVAVTGTGGAEKHTLTQSELPNVNLPLSVKAGQADNLDNNNSEIVCNPANVSVGTNPLTLNVPLGGSATPFSVLPQYIGVYFIKRTGRVYYAAP